jgi:hypothetical protein
MALRLFVLRRPLHGGVSLSGWTRQLGFVNRDNLKLLLKGNRALAALLCKCINTELLSANLCRDEPT